MKLIASKDIDRQKWDELVNNHPTAPMYNQSIFLDHLSENWMLLVNEEYSCGMPIPFTIRLNQKGIYTPNFIRFVSWITLDNSKLEDHLPEVMELLKSNFNHCSLQLQEAILATTKDKFVFQYLDGEATLNSQAKRAIKKFEKSSFELSRPDLDTILPIVSEELVEKVKSLSKNDMLRFENLLTAYPKENYWIIGAKNEHGFQAGLIFIRWKNRLQYIKGGARSEAKEEGAMYAMMQEAIRYAFENQLILDFGGSNIAGVQRFNKSFGAKDIYYHSMEWDTTPKWFRWMKAIKKGLN